MLQLRKLKYQRYFVGYHINEFSRVGTNYGQNYDCRRTMSGTFDSLGLHVFINEHLFSHFSLFKKDIIELMKYSISTSTVSVYISKMIKKNFIKRSFKKSSTKTSNWKLIFRVYTENCYHLNYPGYL